MLLFCFLSFLCIPPWGMCQFFGALCPFIQITRGSCEKRQLYCCCTFKCLMNGMVYRASTQRLRLGTFPCEIKAIQNRALEFLLGILALANKKIKKMKKNHFHLVDNPPSHLFRSNSMRKLMISLNHVHTMSAGVNASSEPNPWQFACTIYVH